MGTRLASLKVDGEDRPTADGQWRARQESAANRVCQRARVPTSRAPPHPVNVIHSRARYVTLPNGRARGAMHCLGQMNALESRSLSPALTLSNSH